jgi:hypothetical protein
VNRYVPILAVVLATLTGCATVGSTHALATPWGAAGIHSFKPEKSDKPVEPSAKDVDAQVAALLDNAQSDDDAVRMATR